MTADLSHLIEARLSLLAPRELPEASEQPRSGVLDDSTELLHDLSVVTAGGTTVSCDSVLAVRQSARQTWKPGGGLWCSPTRPDGSCPWLRYLAGGRPGPMPLVVRWTQIATSKPVQVCTLSSLTDWVALCDRFPSRRADLVIPDWAAMRNRIQAVRFTSALVAAFEGGAVKPRDSNAYEVGSLSCETVLLLDGAIPFVTTSAVEAPLRDLFWPSRLEATHRERIVADIDAWRLSHPVAEDRSQRR